MKNSRVIFKTALLQMKLSFARPTYKFTVVIFPIFLVTVVYFMAKNSAIADLASHLIIGVGLLNLWSLILYSSASDIERERFYGSLEPISITTTPFQTILYGKVLGNLLLSLLSIFIIFFIVVFIFRLPLAIAHPYLLLVAVVLALFNFMWFSLLVAVLFTLSRNTSGLMNTLEYPVFILCGFVFPISNLPKGLQYISFLLSPTWVVRLLKNTITHMENYENYLKNMGILFLLTFIYIIFYKLIYNKLINKALRSGEMGVY